MVPLTLLECGQDRPLRKKELTPHPSPQQAAADSCHGPQYLSRAPLTKRPPDSAAARARSIY